MSRVEIYGATHDGRATVSVRIAGRQVAQIERATIAEALEEAASVAREWREPAAKMVRRCIDCRWGEVHSLALNYCLAANVAVPPDSAEHCDIYDARHIADLSAGAVPATAEGGGSQTRQPSALSHGEE